MRKFFSSVQQHKRSTKFVTPHYIAASLCLVVGLGVVTDENKKRVVTRTVSSIDRVSKLVGTVSMMLVDYAYNIYIKDHNMYMQYDSNRIKLEKLQTDEENLVVGTFTFNGSEVEKSTTLKLLEQTRRQIVLISEEMAELSTLSDGKLSKVHSNNALRLRNMCSQNKGLYIKLGQHISMLDHIVPKEYLGVMSTLLADNPPSSWESVRRVIREDLGAFPEDLFDLFEPQPIASASLAQVHVAWKDGKKYAVKVQHEGLVEGSAGDMAVITALVDLVPLLFRGFNYSWLTAEMNRNLPQELDFRTEVRNLEQCRDTLSDLVASGDVALPVPDKQLSSRRVVTMSFESGCYVTRRADIQQMGLKEEAVAHLISMTFCEQIYRQGFVHCDPHEANLLVRPHPAHPDRPQLVLLDHGLYRKLDDDFRRDYCRLWQALILGDATNIELYCRRLHAGSAFALLAGLLTQRPWDDITSADMNRLKSSGSRADSVMIQAYADKYFKQIVALLGQVPSELLLLFKTGDCLKHLDKQLGAPINTYAVVADVVSDVILREDLAALSFNWWDLSSYRSLGNILSNWFRVRSSLMGLNFVAFVLRSRGYLLSIAEHFRRVVGCDLISSLN